MTDQGNGRSPEDPAPNGIEVHRERLRSVVVNARATALEQGRIARERHDTLMRSIGEKGDTLEHAIDEYCQLCASVVDSTHIMSESLEVLVKRFSDSPIPDTIKGSPMRKKGEMPKNLDQVITNAVRTPDRS